MWIIIIFTLFFFGVAIFKWHSKVGNADQYRDRLEFFIREWKWLLIFFVIFLVILHQQLMVI